MTFKEWKKENWTKEIKEEVMNTFKDKPFDDVAESYDRLVLDKPICSCGEDLTFNEISENETKCPECQYGIDED